MEVGGNERTLQWTNSKSRIFFFFLSSFKLFLLHWGIANQGLLQWLSGKESACNAGDAGLIPGSGRSSRWWAQQPTLVFLPEESHGQRSLAGYRPQGQKESHMTEATEHAHMADQDFPSGASGKEPGCQFRGRKRPKFNPQVRKIPWRRAQQPAPVFLPGEFHRQGSLVGCSPQGCTLADTTEVIQHDE